MADDRVKVLIVDDEESIRRVMVSMLEGIFELRKYKIEVVTATNGLEAAQLIESSEDFLVVISDWKMPHMDGAKLLEKIKAMTNRPEVIIMSGYPLEKPEGAIAVLKKPFSLMELEAVVIAALHK